MPSELMEAIALLVAAFIAFALGWEAKRDGR
jgi:hypothetical protein